MARRRMHVSPEIESYFHSQGWDLLSTEQGIEALEKAVHLPLAQLTVYTTLENKTPLLEKQEERPCASTEINHALLREKIIQDLKTVITDVLKLPISALDAQEELSSYGFDSITFTELANRFKLSYELSITPALFFEYSTIEKFADYLLSEHVEALQQKYSSSIPRHPLSQNKALPKAKFHALKSTKTDMVKSLSQKTSMPDTDIAIIGMAGIFPNAPNVDTFWQILIESKDCISEIPKERWDWQAYAIPKWAGLIEDIDKFDADFLIFRQEKQSSWTQTAAFSANGVEGSRRCGLSH